MPFKPKFTITPKINQALVEIERVRGFLDAITLKDEWIADIKRTATRDLSGLVEKDILERKGEKKGSFYVLASKIVEKIRDNRRHS